MTNNKEKITIEEYNYRWKQVDTKMKIYMSLKDAEEFADRLVKNLNTSDVMLNVLGKHIAEQFDHNEIDVIEQLESKLKTFNCSLKDKVNLYQELLDFLEANNWLSLKNKENSKTVIESYIKVYKPKLHQE